MGYTEKDVHERVPEWSVARRIIHARPSVTGKKERSYTHRDLGRYGDDNRIDVWLEWGSGVDVTVTVVS